MSADETRRATLLEAIRETLAERPDGVLERVAEAHGAPLQTVVEALPEPERVFVPGERFAEIWASLGTWGEVLFLMHARTVVLEVVGRLAPGTVARGWFNVHGDSPIGGHIRADLCRAIYLVDRPFHGRRSCSVQFFDEAGGSMFKAFVRRGPDRTLDPAQLAAFEALRERLSAE
ncbi:heme utilization cystosolic carrier protein HutX [Salinarimonas sp.]|uniref:heme utilization cystosolic carrier protein HutX n=1 Tax=Salinarimonas sp. TaxID=2766526 RepID=UPI0032D8B7A2